MKRSFIAAAVLGLALVAPAFSAPKVLKKVAPEFPTEAQKAGVEKGSVQARLTIKADGTVSSVEVVETSHKRVFDRAVKEALMDWKFEAGSGDQTYDVKLVFNAND